MPMVLIGILGAALGSLMNSGGIEPFAVILVNADQPVRPAVPPGTPAAVIEQLPTLHLGKILEEDVLASDQVREIMHVTVATDLDEAKATVADGKAVAVIHVPADFSASVLTGSARSLLTGSARSVPGKAPNVDLYADPAAPTETAIVEQIVQIFTEQVTTGSLATQLVGPERAEQVMAEINAALPEVADAAAGAKPVEAIQYYAAAMAIMFMVMTAFDRAKEILQERQEGTLARILTSPTGKATLIAGQILGSMAILMAQFLILLIGTRLLYQVDWGSWPGALLLGAAFSLAAAGIGTAAAGIFTDPRAADSATGTAGVVFAALSGAMLPLYVFPDGLKLMARAIPNYWALQGLLDQMAGLGPSYLWTPVAVLTGIGIVTAGVGAWRLAVK